jgi:rhodanese-related sulfurtransferase
VRKSAKALKFLKKELGFTTIVYLDGGLGDWEELGFAISIE